MCNLKPCVLWMFYPILRFSLQVKIISDLPWRFVKKKYHFEGNSGRDEVVYCPIYRANACVEILYVASYRIGRLFHLTKVLKHTYTVVKSGKKWRKDCLTSQASIITAWIRKDGS